MFGILNIRKPVGPTSRDCVNAIQKLVRPVKVGHAGTLDPLASGVLLLLVGQAVRLTDAVHTLHKQYVGRFQLGLTSESSDTEEDCQVVPDAPILNRLQLETLLPQFIGNIEQVPPKYSAVRIDGQRAHERVRSGQTFAMPSRRVQVDALELVSFDYPFFELSMTCGTGTYVRSIGRDLALSLGSDAVMTHLVRTSIGPFRVADSCELESISSQEDVAQRLAPARDGVRHWPQVFPSDETLVHLEQGKRVDASMLPGEQPLSESYAAAIDSDGRLRALVIRKEANQWRAGKCFLR